MLVSVNLDGTGVCTSNSQIPFLDHMMDVRPNAVPSTAYFARAGPAARQSVLAATCLSPMRSCPCCGCCLVGDVSSTTLQLSSAPCTAQQLASHGLFNVIVEAEGDTWIDDHHTNEDIGIHFLWQVDVVVIRV